MKIIICFFSLIFLFNSCKQKDQLQPSKLKKVFLVKIDYLKNKFEGGKEFSYFTDDSNSEFINVTVDKIINDTIKQLIFKYGTSLDTIFSATEVINGQGEIIYPNNFDSFIYYFKLDGYDLSKPDNSTFQTLYSEIAEENIPYDSIWKAVSNLEKVETYRNLNSSAKIGLFLIRPSLVSQNPGDWKWYLIFKE
jgi:hypothetical protein